MEKYDVWFCSCGRIQIMPCWDFEWMQEDCAHRRVIRVCQNCGATYMMFLTDNGEGFDINGTDVRDTVINSDDGMQYKIIFDGGIKVPLMCGEYADSFCGGKYVNWEYCEKTLGTTYLPDAEAKEPNCTKVDVERLMRMCPEDVVKSISGYAVGVDWAGTPYELKF